MKVEIKIKQIIAMEDENINGSQTTMLYALGEDGRIYCRGSNDPGWVDLPIVKTDDERVRNIIDDRCAFMDKECNRTCSAFVADPHQIGRMVDGTEIGGKITRCKRLIDSFEVNDILNRINENLEKGITFLEDTP